MSGSEVLRAHEAAALDSKGVISRVHGKPLKVLVKSKKHKQALGATGLITAMLVGFLILFSSGNLIPAAISERLVEATDVQYADAVASKMLVFQQALASGSVPENTVKRLQDAGVKVEGTSLVYNGRTITAGDFITAVKSDAGLYQAFNEATYNRAAYYYDESAEEVFRKIGTSRNNYSTGSDFSEVMSSVMGSGSNINVNNVGLVEKYDEETEETYTEYETLGETVGSQGSEASEFVAEVAEKNIAETETTATLNSANALNIADTITKEQKSSLYFLAFMENISKMKAGDGNSSKINEAMNYLYTPRESSVVDVNTGEIVTVKGSMLESPSLYAVLAGKPINADSVKNYASDRVLLRVENNMGASSSTEEMHETVTSTGSKTRGIIGRWLEEEGETGNYDQLASTVPIINDSMINNSFDTIGGIRGGEMLVEGAVNVGGMLAQASGATVGDASAVKSYARLTGDILALDAEVDRKSRSPFDVSSPNTFLGSIFYKLAINVRSSSGFNSVGAVVSDAVKSLVTPSTYADDQTAKYLDSFGNCKTIQSIGGVGTVGCSKLMTFDTSTLNDTFNNGEFLTFIEENTTLNSSGEREVREGSTLAEFLKYNNERITPAGVMDGGILKELVNGSGFFGSIPFVSDFVEMIKAWLGADEDEKRIATGESFVNSSSNGDWGKYKYAQRYVSLARATAALRQYDGGATAYNNIPGFEGSINPVVAYLEKYRATLANK